MSRRQADRVHRRPPLRPTATLTWREQHRTTTRIDLGFGTRAIHAGQRPDPTTGAIMTPVYQTSTYVQPELGRHLGYEYARTQNPTREALEGNVAALEGGRHGLAFASGLAATDTVSKLLSAGDHVVSGEGVYGGTYRLFSKVISRLGIEFTFVDSGDLDADPRRDPAEHEADPRRDADQPDDAADRPRGRRGDRARGRGAAQRGQHLRLAVQPAPLELGADLVIHSTTKYLNGHSDMVGGLVIVNDDELHERLRFLQNAAGAVPGPWDCWLALRGTKTLHLRMRQHNENGQRIAEWLEEHEAVERVYYPGLRRTRSTSSRYGR
jgi:cystathionine gamma-lyase